MSTSLAGKPVSSKPRDDTSRLRQSLHIRKMVGNKPNYEKEDVIRAFLLIGEKPISRSDLVKKIGVGEGSIRTILDILKYNELLISKKKGHLLSEKGKRKKKTLEKEFSSIKKLSLNQYKGMKSVGLQVKNPGTAKIGFEQRDEAIRKGAYSAIIFRHEKDIKVPGVEIDFRKDYSDDYKKIKDSFEFSGNEILIVTFAKDYRTCENSAIAVVNKIYKKRIF
ncbi:DUF4443 domain-containing protein [Bacteroidota bacterium]